jgi:CheY-like chemotaxis protein
MIPTILLIEDNTLNLELARDVLITAEMKVVEARTAHDPVVALTAQAMVGDREQALAPGRPCRSAGGKAA